LDDRPLFRAEMLLERGDPRDRGRALPLLAASLGDAEALGMAWVASRARDRHTEAGAACSGS
jgi:hypothetical protein